MKYNLIDVGTHVAPPSTMWQERFPKELRDYAPFPMIKTDHALGEYEVLVLEGVEYRQWAHSIGIPRDEYPFNDGLSRYYSDGRSGCHEPKGRVEDMAIDGIDASVIVRNNFPQLQPKDLRTRWGLIRAYNDWIGEFCSFDPDRLIGVGELPTWDMALMLDEVRKIKDMGLRAVLLPIVPGFVGDWSQPAEHSYMSAFWEPLWTELENLELTIVAHIDGFAVTDDLSGYNADALLANDAAGTIAGMMTNKSVPAEMIASMIMGHVFDRHPKLQIVLNETGIGWAAHFISWSEVLFDSQAYLFDGFAFKHRPKEYFNKHVIASFLRDSCGVKNRDIIGIESFAWCSDYPENYGTFGKAKAQIDKDLVGTNEAERHAILAGNAVRAFRL